MPEATGTETAGTETTGAAENAGEQPAKTAAPVVPPAAQTTDSGKDSGETAEAKAARLEREVQQLRQENGKARVTAKEKAAQEARDEVVRDIGKSLGLIKDDEDADPAELRKQIEEHQTAVRERDQELAVYRSAAEHDADPNKLLDSRRFLASIKDIDPDDSEKIGAAIKAAIDSDESYKTTQPKAQAAKASGTATTGGSGEGAVTPDQFKAMSGAERNELFRTNPTEYARLAGR